MSKYKPKNQETKALPSKSSRCQCEFLSTDGRRCRQARLEGHKSLCPQHALQDGQLRNAEKTAMELLGPLDDFRSAQAINHALGKLFSLTGQNRIPVRNAAVLAYIAQLLLQTLRPVRNEIIEAGGSNDLDVVFRDALALIRNEFDRDTPVPTGGTLPRRKPRATVAERVQRGLDRMAAAGAVPANALHDPGSAEIQHEEDHDQAAANE